MVFEEVYRFGPTLFEEAHNKDLSGTQGLGFGTLKSGDFWMSPHSTTRQHSHCVQAVLSHSNLEK